MTQNSDHRILLIEHNEDLGSRIKQILTSEGYHVFVETTSIEGLAALKEAGDTPFSLIVSSFRMPKMSGDEILQRAKDIAPDTLRILMVDSSEISTVVKAVNQAKIHGCLGVPFEDEDLINKIRQCCDHYTRIQKQHHLEKVTKKQNQQMYKVALNFKKKDQLFESQIKSREKEKQKLLVSKVSLETDNLYPPGTLTLAQWIEHHNVSESPENFVNSFFKLSKTVGSVLNTIAAKYSIKLEVLNYADIVSDVSAERREPELSEPDAEESSKPDMEESHGPDAEEAPAEEGTQPCETGEDMLQENRFPQLMESLLNYIYGLSWTIDSKAGQPDEVKDEPLDDLLELSVTDDRLKASVKTKKPDVGRVTLEKLLEYLAAMNVRYGIVDDQLIETWLSDAGQSDEFFVIATGMEPSPPKDAQINYFFETDFQQAGKVQTDGSIDFRDRGQIPFVKKETLLAEKIPLVMGKAGTDISGIPIPVEEAVDKVFVPGAGTLFSEDQLKIFADSDGQPHLDAMGTVSVFSELNIKGDVDFHTGNISFDGNIVVGGIVKEGFKVKGATLTAAQIEGAEIELTGDLNVSSGIIDAKKIKVQGNVQAKYVNNSAIEAFGDLIVQKEIIDSTIFLSGACINETGTIISSKIVAKMGIKARQVGTERSAPPKIRVGVDDHIDTLVARVDEALEKNHQSTELLKQEISDLESEDDKLSREIAEYAHVQDRSQIELRDIAKKLSALKASGDVKAVSQLVLIVKDLNNKASQAEHNINEAFSSQDGLSQEIRETRDRIKTIEEANKTFVEKKKALREYSGKDRPLAEIKVNKTIMPGTKIEASNSVIRIKDKMSRCMIHEVQMGGDEDGGLLYYEMAISNL